MEAPEKIYILKHSDYSDRRILNAFTEKETNNDVEYVRNDVFINKACEWLLNNFKNYSTNELGSEYLIEDFKNYMKGSEI